MKLDLKQKQLDTFWYMAQRDVRKRRLNSIETGGIFLREANEYLKKVCRGLGNTDIGFITLGPYALHIQIHNEPERVVEVLKAFFGAGHHDHKQEWNGEKNMFVIDLEPVIVLEEDDEEEHADITNA